MNHPTPNTSGAPALGAPVAQQIKPSTKNKYDAIWESHMAQYLQWARIAKDEQFPWKDFAMWLITAVDSRDLSPGYRTMIKSAALHKMRNEMTGEDVDTAARIVNQWDPVNYRQVNGDEEPKRRSRASKRMIPKKDWSILINHFNMRPCKWGNRAQSMLSASIGCGARPIEWVYAHLVAEDTVRIYDAKIKNINAWNATQPGRFREGKSGINPAIGSENEVFRDVSFSPEFRLPIQLTIRYVDEFFQEEFGPDWRNEVPRETLEKTYTVEFYGKSRIATWRACNARFNHEKLYSMADARSTFAANRKAQFGIERASADLGHSGTSQTRNNYAPARKAWR